MSILFDAFRFVPRPAPFILLAIHTQADDLVVAFCRITLAFPHLVSGDATASVALPRCCKLLYQTLHPHPRGADEVFLPREADEVFSFFFFLSLSPLLSFSLLFSLFPLLFLSLICFSLSSCLSFLSASFSFPCLFTMPADPAVCALAHHRHELCRVFVVCVWRCNCCLR